jgi:ArsR family transcriptional regulator
MDFEMKTLARTYRALADETRLQILGLILQEGELCVCDVTYVLDITQSKASRHLRYLLNAGLLEDRRDGVWMHYRIPERLTKEKRIIFASLQQLLTPKELRRLVTRLKRWRKQQHCDPYPAANLKTSLIDDHTRN